MLHGMDIATGVDLGQLVEAGDFISRFLGRPNGSKVAVALQGGCKTKESQEIVLEVAPKENLSPRPSRTVHYVHSSPNRGRAALSCSPSSGGMTSV